MNSSLRCLTRTGQDDMDLNWRREWHNYSFNFQGKFFSNRVENLWNRMVKEVCNTVNDNKLIQEQPWQTVLVHNFPCLTRSLRIIMCAPSRQSITIAHTNLNLTSLCGFPPSLNYLCSWARQGGNHNRWFEQVSWTWTCYTKYWYRSSVIIECMYVCTFIRSASATT